MFKSLLLSFACLITIQAMEIHVNRAPAYFYDTPLSENYEESRAEYTATIYLGEPLQEISNVILDSGSYMSWIKVSNWCNQTSCPGVTPVYQPELSQVFNYQEGETRVVQYPNGAMVGDIADDMFCFSKHAS